MLSEHELETIEKMFPSGFVITWVVKSKRPRKKDEKPKAKTPKYGIYLYNPDKNGDLEGALRLLAGPGILPPEADSE